MPGTSHKRLALVGALVLALSPFLVAAGPAEEKLHDLTGKVVPLASILEKQGARLDRDASPFWLVLVADDGKVYPLVKDAGSRMFYTDARLLHRPMRLSGRPLAGSSLFQVLAVQSILKGQPHDVFYWCEVCSIRRSENGICECCGGPMELREVPLRK